MRRWKMGGWKCGGLIIVILIVAPGWLAAQEPVKSATPAAALQGFKQALESGDFNAVAQHAGGEPGRTLRDLVTPLSKAREANDRLDKVLKDKKIDFRNPFTAGLTPLADLQLELVDVSKENEKVLARVKCGPRGKAPEETVAVLLEEGAWRVVPPAEIVKQLPARERLKKHITGLEKLAKVLDAVAKEVEAGKAANKEQLLLRLIQLFEEEKLSEYLGA